MLSRRNALASLGSTKRSFDTPVHGSIIEHAAVLSAFLAYIGTQLQDTASVGRRT